MASRPVLQTPADPADPDRPLTAVPGPGRAGRNLPAAIGVGVVLAALVTVPLFSPARWLFIVVVAVAAALGSHEIMAALRTLGPRPAGVPVVAGGLAMVAAAYLGGSEALFLTWLATVVACLLWRLAAPPQGFLRDLAASVFTATYVPFLISFAALLAIPADGPRRVTVFVATVTASDIGGYTAGVLFGKHPMAPTVSPKKSWEGFCGSLLACSLAGAVFFVTLFHASALLGVLFGLAVVATATLGDLGESMVKRDIGIKDMGSLLPGHGGLMDRLDSLLPTAPVALLLLSAFLPTS